MSEENVELVKKLILPPGTDYTNVFRDDGLWAVVRARAEQPPRFRLLPLLSSDRPVFVFTGDPI